MQHEINTLLGGMSIRTIRVLLVEDEFLHTEIMKKLLQKLGVDLEKLTICEDAVTALKQVQRQKFDLVFSDGNLPGMHGLEFIGRLRQYCEETSYFMPIIMLTANRETSYVMEAKKAGVDQFIAKPFSLQILREKIEAAFAERRPLILPDREVITQQVTSPSPRPA